MFLRTGGGARERAGDLRRILEIAPNPEAGKAAVRNYLVADAARTAPDGRVNAPALRRWIDDRKDIWSEFPEMETEFRRPPRNAIRGREERKRGVSGKSGSGRLNIVGSRYITKKIHIHRICIS